jgi:hypothetical protein
VSEERAYNQNGTACVATGAYLYSCFILDFVDLLAIIMSNEPTPEDKARYEAIRKELMQALPKKRAVDKQLVRLCHS